MNRKMLCANPFLLVLVSRCARMGGGLGSTAKTNQLELGVSASEVKNTLGEPSQTQFIADKWVWNYSLHQYWKGFVPYDLFFGKEAQKLDA